MAEATGLYYEWHGPADGTPLILSPGLGGSGGYWQPNLAALSEHYRVLVYDHRGTARSSHDLPNKVSVETMADDLIGLMDALAVPRAHIVGHAAGGLIGLAIALKAPERLDRLVVINGWSTLDPHFARCFEMRLEVLWNSGAAAYIRAQPIFLYPANWSSANNAALEAAEAEHLAHFTPLPNVEKRIAALEAFNIDARLGEISRPVLLIAAADDVLVPSRCSDRLSGGIPGAALETMAWGGHACNVTAPDEFNHHVLEFLGG